MQVAFEEHMTPRRPCVEASALYALLASIAASSLAGCSGKAQQNGPQPAPNATDDIGNPDGPRVQVPVIEDVDTPPLPNRDPAAIICRQSVPSRVLGLQPEYRYDSLAYYTGASPHVRTPPDYQLVETDGTPCATSPNADACLAEVEWARSRSASWWHYDDFFSSSWSLFLATSVEGNSLDALNLVVDDWLTQQGHGAYLSRPLGSSTTAPPADAGAADAGSAGQAPLALADAGALAPFPVVTIDYLEELLAFLGRIDTPNEAALIMFAHGRPIGCAMEREGAAYVATGTWQVSDCPITQQRYELRVTPDGAFSEAALGEPNVSGGCVGRRPEGLCTARNADTRDVSTSWLAHTAHLEAAAVFAFARLEHELAELGAPTEMLARVRRAAEDEVRHSELVGALARARGAQPEPVVVRQGPARRLLEIALENAVEGCVRESWGALCAHFQARSARDAGVRAVWQNIACDETEHAQLSRDVAAWLEARLSPEQRLQVAAARTSAIVALRCELDTEMDPTLVSELGLPDRRTALAQLDALAQHLLDRPLA
jgi:hypothetical protein